MGYYSSYKPQRPIARRLVKKKYGLLFIIPLVLVVTGLILLVRNEKAGAPAASQSTTEQTTNQTAQPEEPMFPDLQPVVNNWVAGHGGTYSVVIQDKNGKVIAESNPDEVMFTASIYKLYVAYVGYQKVADGTYNLDDPYLTGYTRGECLDAMIRDSYSPCGEKMWAELGKESLTAKLKTYGLTDTSMTGLSTTAHDAAIVLQRLYAQKDLTQEHRALYLDSMKTQDALYRRGLPSGFTTATVYNKVGWNETVEWHDTAIVEFTDGRVLIVSVLTKSAGMRNIAGLATVIETAVLASE